MDPIYSFMPPSSYPYPRDQVQYGPNYFQGTDDAAPVHMFMNPARPPANYECWPWGNNYGYPYPPVGCHGCCNHGYFPGHYAWRSQVPPGHYPPFPTQYVPPPHFSMERPWYGYENDMPRVHHCWGCPNHLCNQKEQKSVKIEEEEPDRKGNKNDALAPFQFKNSPFPFGWLPPDYSKNKEHGMFDISEQKDSSDGNLQRAGAWNGWRPFELSNMGSPTESGKKNISSHQSGDGKGCLPFPMVWMPYMLEQKEKEKPKENIANQVPCLESVNGSGEQIGAHASSVTKDIPVKKVEQPEEIVSSRSKEKGSDTSLRDGSDNQEKRAKDDSKRKSSKLPPVCLRVDPMPRRKTANESSQPPSHPGDKQKLSQHSSEVSKVPGSSGEENPDKLTKNEFKANKGVTKTIEVVDGNKCQGESMHVNMANTVNHHSDSQKDVPKNPTEEKNQHGNFTEKSVETVTKAQLKNEEDGKAKEVRAEKENEPRKAKLSEEEAAVVIQSAYRGFDTRRWEPLKKLKQIAKVRERIAEVKDLIRAMALSSDIQGNSKQHGIIAETIMSLLLNLDTIQGLHPSIREVRKCVVRELVSLQEKLDSIANEKSEASTGQESIEGRDEDAFKETMDAISSQNGIENISDTRISETAMTGEQLETKLGKETAEISESYTIGDAKLLSDTTLDNEDERSQQMNKNDEVFVAKNVEDCVAPVLGKCLSMQKNSSEEVTELAPNNEDKLQNELPKLPQDVSGDFIAQEDTKDGWLDSDISKADQANKQEEGLVEVYSSVSKNGTSDEGKHENMEKVLDIPVDESDVDSEARETIPSKLDGSMPEERPVEEYTSEPKIDVSGEGEAESMELHKVLDIPVDKIDVKSEAEGTNPTKLDDPFGTMDEVDKKTEDISFEPGNCSTQLPQNYPTDIFEFSEAFDEREQPAETCNENDATCNILNGDHEMSNGEKSSVSEGLPGTFAEMKPNFESDASLFNKSANSFEADSIHRVHEEAKDKLEVDQIVHDQSSAEEKQDTMVNIDEHVKVVDEGESQIMKASSQDATCEACQGEIEANMVSLSEQPDNAVYDVLSTTEIASPGVNDGSLCHVSPDSAPTRDELNVSNGKLIEENEKLRDMVEKLIKSGEEQMNVISSLSGRVKDLERNLSRKKKLKMKRLGARRSNAVCH